MTDPIRPLRTAASPTPPPTPSRAPSQVPRAPTPPADTAVSSALRSELLQRATRLAAARVAPVALPPEAQIQARLDAFYASTEMTLQTPGGSVSVRIGFRMVQTWERDHDGKLNPYPRGPASAIVSAACRAAGVEGWQIMIGKGTPAHIQALVQELIDRGELANATGATDKDKIRNLMVHFHIGLDCAGYVAQAFLAATGLTPSQAQFRDLGNESLAYLQKRGFTSVRIENARPGDIICLDPPSGESVGHRMIVYESHPATAQDVAEFNLQIATKNENTHGSWRPASGPVTVYQVDTSWGNVASRVIDGARGGVGRGLLMHDEATGVWITKTPDRPIVSMNPYDHPLEGVYRKTQ